MSFAVRLTTDLLQVEPGATASVSIEVANRSEGLDHYEIELEGLDPEWTAIPVPMFDVEAGQVHTERIFLKPPRSSESLAGTYPYVVKIRSLESGESLRAQGVLEVKPYNHFTLDIQPRKGAVPAISRQTTFQVSAMNLGNNEHTLQLYAADLENALAYQFGTDRITIGPGQQKTVDLTVSATKRALLANPRLQVFSVTARSVSQPSASASVQAQAEQRALVSPGSFLILLFFLIILGAWVACTPQPPIVRSATIDKTQVSLGDSVRVTWEAANADSVTVSVGKETRPGLPAKGYSDFVVDEEGELPVLVVARRGNQSSAPFTIGGGPLTASKPISAPNPSIQSFDITPREQTVGQSFLVKYKLGPSVVRATLQPIGQELDPRGEGVQLTAQIAGTIVYKLIATNQDGKTAERSVKVEVVEKSLASIVKFDASSIQVDPSNPRTTLTWQLSNAVRAELHFGSDSIEIDPTTGRRDVELAETTTFRLIAYDANGKTVKKDLTVKVAAPPAPGTPPVSAPGPNDTRKGP